MYELSSDSRSVSSCSSGSNTDELPVTQRESFKRVRRGPGRMGGGGGVGGGCRFFFCQEQEE